MGFWKSERGINGDSWADMMDNCLKVLQDDTVEGSKVYPDEVHEITLGELADVVEFCTRGHLVVNMHDKADASMAVSRLHGDDSTETYLNGGQIQCQTP